jgi:hypothetical protein
MRLAFMFAVGTLAAASGGSRPAVTWLPLPDHSFSMAFGVSNNGRVVGFLHTYNRPLPGEWESWAFLWSRRGVELFNVPGSTATRPTALNEAGDIVGDYVDQHHRTRGFLRSRDGAFSTIHVPGAIATSPSGLNNRRDVVGSFTELTPDLDERRRGFAIVRGMLRVIDNPFGRTNTHVAGLDEKGVMVGTLSGRADDPTTGFVVRGGAWTLVDYPGAEWTSLLDLAPDGTILGYASFVGGESFGFVYRGGTFEDLPPEIQPLGINATGVVVGYSYDAALGWRAAHLPKR